MNTKMSNYIKTLVAAIPEQPQEELHLSPKKDDYYLRLMMNDDDSKSDIPLFITCFTDDKRRGDLNSHWQIRFNDEGDPVYFGDMENNPFNDDEMLERIQPFIEKAV